jgi:Uma2 family endonuclease
MAAINPTHPSFSPAPLASLLPDSWVPSFPVRLEVLSRLRRVTVRQLDQMTAAGLIAEDESVELIEGLLVTKMSRKRPHIVAGKKGLKVLSNIIPSGWHVAKEDSVVVSDWSKPEPDLAVIRGEGADYLAHDVTAADVALVIEIAESTLSIDQTEMGRIYTSSGIPAYWIVNLVDNQLEVYTSPGPDGYRSIEILKPGQEISVVIDGREAGRIAVADLLP